MYMYRDMHTILGLTRFFASTTLTDISHGPCRHHVNIILLRKLSNQVSLTAVHSMKVAYQHGMSEKRAAEDEILLPKKHDQPLHSETLDLKFQKRLCDGGVSRLEL